MFNRDLTNIIKALCDALPSIKFKNGSVVPTKCSYMEVIIKADCKFENEYSDLLKALEILESNLKKFNVTYKKNFIAESFVYPKTTLGKNRRRKSGSYFTEIVVSLSGKDDANNFKKAINNAKIKEKINLDYFIYDRIYINDSLI